MINLEQQITALEQKIQAIDVEREALFRELTHLKHQHHQRQQILSQLVAEATITQYSPSSDKISLFRSLFKGRADVYPKRWENSKTGISGYSFACANEWKHNVCRKNDKPPIKCGDCQFRSFIPVSDTAIAHHLAGTDNPRNPSADFVIGVYPLMLDERCWFLAVDFDKASWQLDVSAFIAACKENSVPLQH